ncbi:MAG: apolipoprotein N-acyltransferase [Treponemataceae bacterium]|nr:apolipoprotein N-acyltransferase [Treponemataceae bacterium]
MIRILQAFFYPLLSAFLLAAGIPNEFFPLGFPAAGFISLVPLYISLYKAKSFSSAGFRVSLQFGTVHLLSSFWLANFGNYAIFTLGATTLVYFLAGFVFGQILYIPFFYSKKKAAFLREASGLEPYASVFRVLLFTSVWTFHEWFKSIGFLAYPWGTLIMTAYRWNFLTQIVSLTGTWGISFLFSLFSAVCGEGLFLLSRYSRERGAFRYPYTKSYACTASACILLLCCSVLYGIYETNKEREPVKNMEAILVQHNVNSWIINNSKTARSAIQLTEKAMNESPRKADLVVWSESILSFAMPEALEWLDTFPKDNPLLPAIRRINTPLILGIPYTEDAENSLFSNSAVLMNPDGTIENHYGKTQLVPFAEYVPYSEKKWMRTLMFKLAGFSSGWTPGDRYVVFNVPLREGGDVSFSTPICFEDAFPNVCRNLFLQGSELFINITNDSWSETQSAEYQHFVIASYRAQEFRTTLVRCTNSGFTAIVNPTGKITDSLPLFVTDSKQFSIPIYEREITPYAMLGDWLPLSVAAFVLITYFYIEIKRKKQKIFFINF